MNKIEKATLTGVRNALKNVAITSWDEGSFDTWATWAKTMKSTINSNVYILDELLKLEEDDRPKWDDGITL